MYDAWLLNVEAARDARRVQQDAERSTLAERRAEQETARRAVLAAARETRLAVEAAAREAESVVQVFLGITFPL